MHYTLRDSESSARVPYPVRARFACDRRERCGFIYAVGLVHFLAPSGGARGLPRRESQNERERGCSFPFSRLDSRRNIPANFMSGIGSVGRGEFYARACLSRDRVSLYDLISPEEAATSHPRAEESDKVRSVRETPIAARKKRSTMLICILGYSKSSSDLEELVEDARNLCVSRCNRNGDSSECKNHESAALSLKKQDYVKRE